MKKGAKLMEDGYLVEISDLDGNYWCAPMTTNSLRRGVAYAAEKVPAMDSYLKVYRDFTATQGAYIAVFLKAGDTPEVKPVHLVVKIRSFQVYTAEGIAHAEAYLKSISEGEGKARKRSISR
jgi:hypothetical protein